MHFCFEHKAPLPRATLFTFFENPKRLELLHRDWSKMRLLACETKVRLGAETWIEITLGGFFPLVLGFRHSVFEPPSRFGEEMIHGPFSKFVHIHEFESSSDGTVVRDLLEIVLPWHYGGEVAMRHLLAFRINEIFRNRAQALVQLVNNGTVSRYSKAGTRG